VSVRHALLALLSEGPKSRLQLRDESEARASETGPPLNVGQLYATLDQLERDGLVETGDGEAAGPHKEYRITAGGVGELAAWLRAPDPASVPSGQTAAKVLAALRLPGTDVHEVVQVHRHSVMELMQQWTRIKQQQAGDDLGLGLRIDAELFRLDSVMRWLNATDGRLMNATVSPPPPAAPTLPRLQGGAGVPLGTAPYQDKGRAADEPIRVSDRDRERATDRLRDAFAEGRLTREELDDRVTAALTARTVGDLRCVIADLP
jgi:DNA-binding PadR family transcriptional regulator